jgi:hypothetical protein
MNGGAHGQSVCGRTRIGGRRRIGRQVRIDNRRWIVVRGHVEHRQNLLFLERMKPRKVLDIASTCFHVSHLLDNSSSS